MKSVAILCKRGKGGTPEILDKLIAHLAISGCEIRIQEDVSCNIVQAKKYKDSELVGDADLFIVLGGDGTLLYAAKLLRGRNVPILGVNLGTLGFLTEIRLRDVMREIDNVFAGNFETSCRSMIQVDLLREDEVILSDVVLNDVVVNKSALARIIKLRVSTHLGFMTSYRADGLIISTPTGSTAYNMSAGGPVLYPTINCLTLTPICPHTFANRPIVIPNDQEIHVELVETNGEVYLTLDGQAGVQIYESDKVILRRAKESVELIKPDRHNYFDILRHKLGWGQE